MMIDVCLIQGKMENVTKFFVKRIASYLVLLLGFTLRLFKIRLKKFKIKNISNDYSTGSNPEIFA